MTGPGRCFGVDGVLNEKRLDKIEVLSERREIAVHEAAGLELRRADRGRECIVFRKLETDNGDATIVETIGRTLVTTLLGQAEYAPSLPPRHVPGCIKQRDVLATCPRQCKVAIVRRAGITHFDSAKRGGCDSWVRPGPITMQKCIPMQSR